MRQSSLPLKKVDAFDAALVMSDGFVRSASLMCHLELDMLGHSFGR